MSTYMKQLNILTLTSLLILLIGILSQPTPVFASHHFESKLATTYPQFDLTDMFVFESERRGYTTFMMNINPTTGKDGNAAFGENGVYSFHIANNKQFNGDGLTITAYLNNGKLIFGLAEGANQAIGTKGQRIGQAEVGTEVTFDNGIRVWSGAARDTFVGNSEGIIGFMTKLLAEGTFDVSTFNKGGRSI